MRYSQILLDRIKTLIVKIRRDYYIHLYLKKGRIPWSIGYNFCKFGFINSVLNDNALISKFKNYAELPNGYGFGFDERVVEYPWTILRLSDSKNKLLDAGSVFNFKMIVNHPKIKIKKFTIYTLAPEINCFWKKGISYHYGDLRKLPFKDEWFDEIISLSTLGHVGMETRLYTGKAHNRKVGLDAEKAVSELLRVLRPGGRLLISVVFGKHQLIEWKDGSVFAEQFNSELLKDFLESFSSCNSISVNFYRYTETGWNIAKEEECQELEYFNIHTAKKIDHDNAAAARAVALIDIIK